MNISTVTGPAAPEELGRLLLLPGLDAAGPETAGQLKTLRERFGLSALLLETPPAHEAAAEALLELSLRSRVRLLYPGADGAVLAAAVPPEGLTPAAEAALAAVADEAAGTNRPLLCRVPRSDLAAPALALLCDHGVDPLRTVLLCPGDPAGAPALTEALYSGCFLAPASDDPAACAALIAALRLQGAVGRLLLRAGPGGPRDVFDRLLPRLSAAGLSDLELFQMLAENPRMLFEDSCIQF